MILIQNMLLTLLTTLLMCGPVGDTQTLSSPDGNLELTFALSEDGSPNYALQYRGVDVVMPSVLGYKFRGRASAKMPENYMRVSYDTQEYNYAESRLSQVRRILPGMLLDNASQHVVGPTAV